MVYGIEVPAPDVPINPFLLHTGKDSSTVANCPKDHGLKLFVSPLGKPCACCGTQMANGSRAWRCFPCDFHMCIECHENGGVYEKAACTQCDAGYTNPHWDGKPMDPFGELETKEVNLLKDLLVKYMESSRLVTVKCQDVIPDFSNRGHTGLSVEHVHKVAQSMARGFRDRTVTKPDDEHSGFDIPVLVRESNKSSGGLEALENWKGIVSETKGFPEPAIHLLRKKVENEMFCSLGNGHFYQALNSFRLGKPSIWSRESFAEQMGGGNLQHYVERYEVPSAESGENPLLRDAVLNGVPALILRNDIPLKDRIVICELLNKKSDYRWSIKAGPDFETNPKDLVIDILDMRQVDLRQSQFELLSKVLDGQELNCLVRQEVGVVNSDRVGH